MKKPIIVMALLIVISLIYTVQGVVMHSKIPGKEAEFHQLQNDYFSQAKVVRDSAETDSDLNKDLVQIKNFPSELLELKLVGVGKILTGIFILLFGILMALMMMPKNLGKIIKGQ